MFLLLWGAVVASACITYFCYSWRLFWSWCAF